MITIHLLTFGPLSELIAEQNLSSEQELNSDSLKALLESQYPALQVKRYVMSVNKKIIHQTISLQDGDEVALLPPFSGG